ncbi:DUF397 domain-containing protein [Streptomyces sp. N2-109]|uniref:DUF397 domain-containing protein n=1 Tax=Streptomyces gossypii TaxID=2883101 RepID=A0ABT2K1Q4_9ACTN|nr:DUF397 domain-containing protein [Streptomyces gossypii]MCT2594105.1 DUF397 domain-containing protein [Streptomyces gossypii]
MQTHEWQVSSHCGEGNSCVGVAAAGGAVKLRESDEPSVTLTTTREQLHSLIAAIKDGAL